MNNPFIYVFHHRKRQNKCKERAYDRHIKSYRMFENVYQFNGLFFVASLLCLVFTVYTTPLYVYQERKYVIFFSLFVSLNTYR